MYTIATAIRIALLAALGLVFSRRRAGPVLRLCGLVFLVSAFQRSVFLFQSLTGDAVTPSVMGVFVIGMEIGVLSLAHWKLWRGDV